MQRLTLPSQTDRDCQASDLRTDRSPQPPMLQVSTPARVGDWMATATGGRFYPLDPRANEVSIADIAHSLSMICRYGGHVSRFLSVAEHCVHVSRAVPHEDALWGLLHDASEAYVGDMIRPLKLSMPQYREAEDRVIAAVCERFGLDSQMPESVREADSRIITNERAVAFDKTDPLWRDAQGGALSLEVQCWGPKTARARFLERFYELCPPDKAAAA